jgi:hypothetical protein
MQKLNKLLRDLKLKNLKNNEMIHSANHLKLWDEVTWTDPDEGTSNQTGIVSAIEYCYGDKDRTRITIQYGWHAEVNLDELS